MMLLIAITVSLELVALTMGCRLLIKTGNNQEINVKVCRVLSYFIMAIALFALVSTAVTFVRVIVKSPRVKPAKICQTKNDMTHSQLLQKPSNKKIMKKNMQHQKNRRR